MNERDAIIWLHRRAGFGLAPAELNDVLAAGSAAELDRLLAPQSLGGRQPDPWDDAQLPAAAPDAVRDKPSRYYAIGTWLDTMATTTQPLADRIAWLWHGHFVSAFDKVKIARLMVDQIRLFRRSGLGRFTDLLHDVTIDPAMMLYLDLRTSTGSEPNENYAREVMELFTLGVGNFAEPDVHSGGVALTGWTLQQRVTPQFVARRHDDTPQTYLGVDGVHDLDTVVAAIASQPAMATFIAATMARELLGAAPPDVVQQLATTFTSSNFDVRTLVRATLQAGLDGTSAPIVLGPAPWLAVVRRATGAELSARQSRQIIALLRDAGQVPMLPPNVAGWPGGPAWFASASMVARANLAALVAEATPSDSAALVAAQTGDAGALAEALALPSDGFGPSSAAALSKAPAGTHRLALALAAPEMFVV